MMVEVSTIRVEELFKYYGTKDRPIAHFPFNFDFTMFLKRNFTAADILRLVDDWFDNMPEGSTANWLVGNHDTPRLSARLGEYAVDPFNMITHLLPGASVTYYGEEIGMQNTWISWEDTVVSLKSERLRITFQCMNELSV